MPSFEFQILMDMPTSWADEMDLQDNSQQVLNDPRESCSEKVVAITCERQSFDTTYDIYSLCGNELGEILPVSASPAPLGAKMETRILEVVLDLMESPSLNPHRGSVSVESLLAALTKQLERCCFTKGTLQRVLYHRTFDGFLAAQTHLFAIVNPDNPKKRVRCLHHSKWEEADAQSRKERSAQKAHLQLALKQFLEGLPRRCSTITEFFSAYPKLPCNTQKNRAVELPRAGDLLRMIGPHFKYDSKEKVIHLVHNNAPKVASSRNFPCTSRSFTSL
eukprot:GGOE01001361.1.p1 GENE.GGOE01001361.1~~GGOE01001361.1.p1  ORF type:complete len:316 (-),score=39.79 GGOE01001361.1:248-1078(-)